MWSLRCTTVIRRAMIFWTACKRRNKLSVMLYITLSCNSPGKMRWMPGLASSRHQATVISWLGATAEVGSTLIGIQSQHVSPWPNSCRERHQEHALSRLLAQLTSTLARHEPRLGHCARYKSTYYYYYYYYYYHYISLQWLHNTVAKLFISSNVFSVNIKKIQLLKVFLKITLLYLSTVTSAVPTTLINDHDLLDWKSATRRSVSSPLVLVLAVGGHHYMSG